MKKLIQERVLEERDRWAIIGLEYLEGSKVIELAALRTESVASHRELRDALPALMKWSEELSSRWTDNPRRPALKKFYQEFEDFFRRRDLFKQIADRMNIHLDFLYKRDPKSAEAWLDELEIDDADRIDGEWMTREHARKTLKRWLRLIRMPPVDREKT